MENKTILIIEDDENTMKFMSITLNKEGYEVLESKNGITALDILRDSVPDCIIIDIILPDIEGCTIFNEIKNNEDLKNIPLIFSSGKIEAKEEYANLDPSEQPTAFLLKPFSGQDLVSTINSALS